MANSQDACYLSLLALAESFRTQEPANIKACVQCLQAVLTFKPPPKVEARTHLQLGILLTHYTNNTQLAISHLEQAWQLSMNIIGFDDVKFESASVLARLYEEKSNFMATKSLLRKALEMSSQSGYWYCRILFQTAQISLIEREYSSAANFLQMGVEYTHMQGMTYAQVLFMLSKVMIMLYEGKSLNEVQPLLNQASQVLEQYNGSVAQKEHLRVYFLVLLVYQNLYSGQVKSAKPSLKQLQQAIQNLNQVPESEQEVNSGNNFDTLCWMPKEHLFILVYLVSVMHSVQAGHMEKAQMFTDKALSHIEKLKIEDSSLILTALEVLLTEHNVMCHLIKGSKVQAIQEIAKVCRLLHKCPQLLQRHKGLLHALLAVYAMSMNNQDAAEKQFKAALKVSENKDLWLFANLNLAVVYLRCKREEDFLALQEKINPEMLSPQSYNLKATAYYVQGLHSFFYNRHEDGKRFLRESLKMANAEDLNRLISCSLLLLGHIFLALGSPRDASNMVTPAMQLASKIPDNHLQLWASAILKDVYRQLGESAKEKESHQNHYYFSQTLVADHVAASKLSEHSLIHWTEGPLPHIVS